MGSYGRNFDFRVMPFGAGRGSRFLLSTSADIPIGAPVKYDSGVSTTSFGPDNAVIGVSLATTAQDAPRAGLGGIAVYEHAPAAFAGTDPVLTNYSDMDLCPKGKLIQVINGTQTKVVLTTTLASTFLQTRSYTGRVMVAGLGGATTGDPVVGSLLTPGVGDGTSGYWAVTATASEAWLVVTAASQTHLEVEAKLTF